MEFPLISVVIPCYNSERYIHEAIKSAIAQTYSNIEVIVVDDGSTDRSASIIASITDPRLRYCYQENSGLSAARNTGMKNSKGTYIAFLDSDDVWLPNKLEKQYGFLKTHDVVFCSYFKIDGEGKVINERDSSRKYVEKQLKYKLLKENGISGSGSSVVLSMKVVDSIGFFDESLRFGEDWEYWTRASWKGHSYGFCSDRLVKIRVDIISLTALTSKAEKTKAHKKILNSFLTLDGVGEKEKSIIYKKHAQNGYWGGISFGELLSYVRKSIQNDSLRLLDFGLIFLPIRFILREIYHRGRVIVYGK